jgi:putative NIF3 family GTP cyclohydrolase 1 type 2
VLSLTPAVLTEALASPTSLIVSYHPPIFKPLTSFTLANPLQSSLLQCAAQGISVYSPHTAADSVWGGVNDWLAEGVLGSGKSNNEGGDIRVLGKTKFDLEGETEGGEGRLVTLNKPVQMNELEQRIMRHLGLSQSPSSFAIWHRTAF